MNEQNAVLVLAGGSSQRFGRCKLTQMLPGGTTVLEAALRAPLGAGVGPVIVVTGAYHAELEPILRPLPVQVVQNQAWASGMASSMRAGLGALPSSASGVLICLGDQPHLPAEVIVALVEARQRTGARLVSPSVSGQRRNPVLFDRTLVPELMAVTGDEGGRSVVQRHLTELALVEFSVPHWFVDVDTPDDLQRT